MLKRFRRHLNPPMVVATIALFAALGGGYATAFSGSGTLQKAKVQPGASFADARSVNGFGDIRLLCDGPNNAVDFEFENQDDNGPAIIVRTYEQNANDHDSDEIPDGATEFVSSFAGFETTTFHMYRNDLSRAVATGSITSIAVDNLCGLSSISVLNSVE